MNDELFQIARDSYVTVNNLVIETLEQMAPLIRAGAEMPDKFAATTSWFAAQDAIDKAIADNNRPKVEMLCREYESRAAKYCQAVLAGMKQAA